jgi:hypothetical protein
MLWNWRNGVQKSDYPSAFDAVEEGKSLSVV